MAARKKRSRRKTSGKKLTKKARNQARGRKAARTRKRNARAAAATPTAKPRKKAKKRAKKAPSIAAQVKAGVAAAVKAVKKPRAKKPRTQAQIDGLARAHASRRRNIAFRAYDRAPPKQRRGWENAPFIGPLRQNPFAVSNANPPPGWVPRGAQQPSILQTIKEAVVGKKMPNMPPFRSSRFVPPRKPPRPPPAPYYRYTAPKPPMPSKGMRRTVAKTIPMAMQEQLKFEQGGGGRGGGG